MRLKLENVGCIKETNVEIIPKKINVKYGINGIGKSTLIKVLDSKINGKDNNERLTSYKFDGEKNIDVYDNEFDCVEIYDTNYFEELFKQSDVIENAYELFVKNDFYENGLKEINSKIENLRVMLSNNKITEFVDYVEKNIKLDKFVDFKQNGAPKSTVSILKSFVNDGIFVKVETDEAKEYVALINSKYRTEWTKWIKSAKNEWIIDDKCPYCANKVTNLSNKINELSSVLDSKKFEENDKNQMIMRKLKDYSNDEKKLSIDNFLSIDEKPTVDSVKDFNDMAHTLRVNSDKIKKLSQINAQTFINHYENSIDDRSKGLKELRQLITSNKLSDIIVNDLSNNNLIDKINTELDKISAELDEVIGVIEVSTKKLLKTLNLNAQLINEFLRITGIPYEICFENRGANNISSILKFRNKDKVIENRLNYLSYGEANTLALILFVLQAKNMHKGQNVLFVLDDPISSYDNYKRYAIFNYLLTKQELLKSTTTLLLTHDFKTITTMCFSIQEIDNSTVFNYLYQTPDGILSEEIFKKNDIVSIVNKYEKIVKDNAYSNITRICSARNYCEIVYGKDDCYNYLSSIQHYRTEPTIDSYGKVPMDEATKKSIEERMKVLFNEPTFKYDDYIIDEKSLLAQYDNTNNQLEKLCIARLVIENNDDLKTDNYIWKFLSGLYHIESNNLFLLSKYFEREIPNYLILCCDEVINNYKKTIK